ncbi:MULTISPECIES: hypothetical protein [unclassified Uliginosibacterium]|uniref:hypothetical protein n=1 Tax=unclassified Uliginosibacterium TaxID=2621521 RepID=UPI000C7DCEA1|nr:MULTISPECIES: hypothetical protein [unclassified Uliginosibacterium]MDO6387299.1 hypothetical protein [Uliginosibacterium sp. 31-12]PLK50692.1 hypothetical protein C0V76_02450 [Uliginosibacterium sp. TH139]
MSLEWIGVVFLLLGAGLLWSAPERLLSLQIVACVFAGSAAFSLPALGGATVAPGFAVLLLLALCVLKFGHLHSMFEAMAPRQPGFPLLMLVVWGFVSAAVLPRLFGGEVDVVSMNRSSVVLGAVPVETLAPGSGNITQSVYAAGELVVFAVALVFLRLEGGLERAGRAMLWLAGLNLIAAVIDLGGYYSGLGNLLEPLQTANFAFMPEAAFGNVKRINGTFPEASAFAGFTLPLMAFCYVLWRERCWPRLSGPLALGSLLALLLATSSAGYGGLGVYAALVLVISFCEGWRPGGHTHLWHYLGLGLAAALVIGAILALLPAVREQAWDIIENTLLYKSSSSSAIERGEWNQISWQAFLDTWGLGAGMGSARASSLPMVLVSNVGLPGSLLFLAFLARVLLAKLPAGIDATQRALVIAARHGVLAALIIASLVASVFDLGVMFYLLCAIACCPALLYVPRRTPQARPVMASDGVFA